LLIDLQWNTCVPQLILVAHATDALHAAVGLPLRHVGVTHCPEEHTPEAPPASVHVVTVSGLFDHTDGDALLQYWHALFGFTAPSL
jgi:hypothetical protein